MPQIVFSFFEISINSTKLERKILSIIVTQSTDNSLWRQNFSIEQHLADLDNPLPAETVPIVWILFLLFVIIREMVALMTCGLPIHATTMKRNCDK